MIKFSLSQQMKLGPFACAAGVAFIALSFGLAIREMANESLPARWLAKALL